jgi:hypothetical protein
VKLALSVNVTLPAPPLGPDTSPATYTPNGLSFAVTSLPDDGLKGVLNAAT